MSENFTSIKTFRDFLLDKQNPIVMVTLLLSGKSFLEKATFRIELRQHTNAHDEFCIVVPDTAVDSFEGYVLQNSKNLLGQKLTVSFHRYGVVVQSFTGVISKIINKKNKGGGYGDLHIIGHAPSILLENGKDCQSFQDKTLPEIIAQSTAEYGNDVEIKVEGGINHKYTLPYTVQYKESDYQFLSRLARRYGEFFYYNGTHLIFGNQAQNTVEVEEGSELIDVEFELLIKPQKFTYVSYDVEKGELQERPSYLETTQNKENPFAQVAKNASERVYQKIPEMYFSGVSQSDVNGELEAVVRREKEHREHLMQVRGRSREPQLRIGGFIKLRDINNKAMETYRIIDIKHYQSGYEYYNEFVAIPDVFVAYYFDENAYARSEQQPAQVVDNDDPEGLGRVCVQFLWQRRKGEKTPWIRVAQPHAGAGKGFYFIPEIGEEVLVDFEDQNAERPFVSGSYYNGKQKSNYHTAGNDKKVIHTRSGTKIILNDAEGSVFIEDPSGNSIHLDGKQKISFNGATLEFNAQKIIMNASESTQITTNDYILNALSKIYVFSNWFKQQINGFTQFFSTKTLIKGAEAIDIEAKEAKLHGTEKMIAHSDKLALVNSKETLEVKGQKGNNYSNKAEDVQTQSNEEIGLAVVHFRPDDNWQGEYGFDWLRIDDKHFTKSDDPPYRYIIQGGYTDLPDAFGNPRDLDRVDAYKQLKTQYHIHPIKRKDNSNDNTEYFTPYISLFSREYVKGLSKLLVKPKFRIKIKVLVEIEEDIDRLELEYDKNLFHINKKKLSDTKKTPLKDGGTIVILCKKDLTEDTSIKVYAYPKENPSIENRKLAGRLIVLQNDSKVRKEEKFVFVKIKTNVNNKPRADEGKFDNGREKINFYNTLYQSLVIPVVEKKEKILDLSNNNDFKITTDTVGRQVYGKFVDNPSGTLNDNWAIGRGGIVTNNFIKNIQTLFLEDKDKEGNLKNQKYQNYFTIFSLATGIMSSTTSGKTDSEMLYNTTNNTATFVNFRKNVMLFKNRDEYTLNHEVLHGLGVFHIHREIDNNGNIVESVITEKNKKYIYPLGATTNTMAYNSNAYCTWRWQWHIINPNIKER